MFLKRLWDVPIPSYANDGDAGMDLVAAIEKAQIFYPGETRAIQTGIAVAIPRHHVGLLCVRSSLGKRGLSLANSVGVIDSGYRGEIVAMLKNHSANPVWIEPLERIVQLLVVPCVTQEIELVDALPESARGANGFGSTGS